MCEKSCEVVGIISHLAIDAINLHPLCYYFVLSRVGLFTCEFGRLNGCVVLFYSMLMSSLLFESLLSLTECTERRQGPNRPRR